MSARLVVIDDDRAFREILEADPVYVGTALEWAVESNNEEIAADMLQGVLDGLGGARRVEPPSVWLSIGPKLLASFDRTVRERAMTLAVA